MWMHGIIWIAAVFGSLLWFRRRKKETGILLAVICAGNLIGTALTFRSELEKNIPAEGLLREEQTEEGYSQELVMSLEGDAKQQITVQIPPKEYTRQEKIDILQQERQKLDGIILGENTDFSHIDKPLAFPEEMEDYPVYLEWNTSRPDVVDWEGNLGEVSYDEGIAVTITAMLHFQEEELEYRREIVVCCGEMREEERLRADIQKKIDDENKENSGERVKLPSELNGAAVQWEYPLDTAGYSIVFLSVIAAFVICAAQYRSREREQEETRERLLREYPEVISKITLFLQAGMSMRQVFARIAADYEKGAGKYRKKKLAYEEIVETCREMERGVSEEKAYESFGRRCAHPYYKTLAVLLVQNLKKGNRDLVFTLQRESMEAFENRKRQAKEEGEKAATKLLIPMVLMLIVVFIILLVPACLTFL